jgi:hypothetical protein
MSREGKVKKKYVYGKERKKNRKVKKNMCIREWKRVIENEKREKERKRNARKI